MDQIFTILEAMQSDDKDENDELMKDFDTKFIAPEDIELTHNPGNLSALTLEATVCWPRDCIH